MSSFKISRRAVLGAMAAAPLISACSKGGSGGAAGDSAAPTDFKWPAVQQVAQIDGAVISKVEGIPPAYGTWPKNATKSVETAPGKGQTIRSIAPTWSTVPPSVDKNEWAQEIEKQLNIKWEPSIVTDYNTVYATMFAGGDLPELVYLQWVGMPTCVDAIENGAFTDLTPYLSGDNIKKYPNIAQYPEYAWRASVLNGKMWVVPSIIGQVGQFRLWRSDWTEAEGVTGMPKDTDEMYSLLEAISKKHPGGADSYAFSTFGIGQGIVNEAFGLPTYYKLENGKFISTFEDEAFPDAMVFLNKMWKGGLFHPDALSMAQAKERDLFGQGKGFMATPSSNLWYGNGATGMRADLAKADPNAKVAQAIMPPSSGRDRSCIGWATGFWGGAAIPAKYQDDEELMDTILGMINYWAAPFGTEEFLLIHNGIEGKHFNFDSNGQPVPTTDTGKLEELNANVMTQPAFLYFAGDSTAAAECQKYMEASRQYMKPNPASRLISKTEMSKGTTLDNLTGDYVRKFATGDLEVNSANIEKFLDEWRSSGGSQIEDEYAEQYEKYKEFQD